MAVPAAAAAVLSSALVCGKILEALRCHRINKTMKAAQLPSVDSDDSGEPDGVVQDPTGAMARVLPRPDGVQLYVRELAPSEGTEKRGLVVMVHGWSWHSRYFMPLAQKLAAAGFAVVAYDLRGHGLSGLEDGLPGYTRQFQRHGDDLLAVLRHAQGRHAGARCFLLAESFGAAVVHDCLTRLRDEAAVQAVRGRVLLGPVLRTKPELLPPPAVIKALHAVALAFPKLPVPGQKVTDTFDEAFPDTATADEARRDPLVILEPARIAFAATFLAREASMYGEAAALWQPLLILHGEKDYKAPLDTSKAFVAEAQAEDRKLETYAEGHHQLLQDKGVADEVMSDVLAWLQQRTL